MTTCQIDDLHLALPLLDDDELAAALIAAAEKLYPGNSLGPFEPYCTGFALWLDPSCTFRTMGENKPLSAVGGIFQKRRGVRSGLPDVLVIFSLSRFSWS